MTISFVECRVVVTWWEIRNILLMESVLTPFKLPVFNYRGYPRIPGMLKIEFNLGSILSVISPGI